MNHKYVLTSFITGACFLLAACSTTIQTEQSGKVIDASTLLPADKVVVISVWRGYRNGIFQYTSTCPLVMMVETVDGGAFEYPAQKVHIDGMISDLTRHITAYKPGYIHAEEAGSQGSIDIYIKPFNGPGDERLKYIQEIIHKVSCGKYSHQLDEYKNLYVLIYREALKASNNDEGGEILTNIRYHMASPWWPSRKGYLPKDAELIFDEHIRPAL
jgi:hypothetical protein